MARAYSQGLRDRVIDAVASGKVSRHSESVDIPVYPSKRGLLIKLTVVGEGMSVAIQGGMGQKSEETKTVVEGDYNHRAFRGQCGRIVVVARTVNKSSGNPACLVGRPNEILSICRVLRRCPRAFRHRRSSTPPEWACLCSSICSSRR